MGIQTFNLTKKYGDLIAVNEINLSIKQGELFSLLGPNGAGKTTTIKMLCCLQEPTRGTAKIMGHDIKQETNKVKQIINVSPQETAVAEKLSLWENIFLIGRLYGLKKQEIKKRGEELINLMELNGRTKEKVKNFSGGMKRKVNIILALISNPQVLFLDEPTLGLDPKSRRELWQQIEKLKQEKTIFLTTHYLEEADALADRIAIIKNGEINSIGTPDELKTKSLSMETMDIKGQNITDNCIQELKKVYPDIEKTEEGMKVKANGLDFEQIIDFLRERGVKIKWLSMKEPSLDEAFLNLTDEEGQ